MDFKEISSHKKQFLELLLLAGEQEDMIDRYLERGVMSLLTHNGAHVVAVVTDEGNGVCELKNIATTPERKLSRGEVIFSVPRLRSLNGCSDNKSKQSLIKHH